MNRKGFTLIELLVVIAIIAILAAILFPVFISAKEHAKVTRCLSNLKNLGSAIRLYADDNSGRMPSAYVGWASPDWCGTIGTGVSNVNLAGGAIWRYANRAAGIFLCSTDRGVVPTYAPGNRNYPLSYTMSSRLHLATTDSIARPTRVLLLIHEARRTIDDGCFHWPDDSLVNLPSNVHYEGTTASYVDGHAKWLSYNKLRQERIDGWWDPAGVK